MLKATKLLFTGAAAALIGVMALPVFAQEVAPGEGGFIIEGNFGGDVANLNPILLSDTASARVAGFIYPGLIGVDVTTATFTENDPAALVTNWEISEDGLVYTFTLRDDWVWSDGTPITSADILYSWNAIINPEVQSRYAYLTEYIEKVEAPTPNTYVVTFKENTCQNLPFASLPIVPSHVLPADLSELRTSSFNLNPTVTGGVFTFAELRPGEQVTLLANQSYGGAPNGVLPTGFIYRNVADQNVLVEQFLAGETNVIDGPAVARRADIAAAGDRVQIYEFPGNAWDYFAMNFADPNNPQPALDENGNRIDQGQHPIFGDPRVRRAVALAVNVDDMIQAAVFGQGERMNAFSVQSSWAYPNDLPMIEQNVDEAVRLLEEAGWMMGPDGVRVKDGRRLSFTLFTNQGNSRREAIGAIFEAQLEAIGFEVDYQAIEFNTILDLMDQQNFDAIILGWRNGYPDDPDQTSLFTTVGDTLGGNNFTSYYNPEVDRLMAEALVVPGCDFEARAEIYRQIQAILQADLPYIPLFTLNGYYAASADIEGFNPFPSALYWNVDRWQVRSR
ncbi:MAG: ABC transporter substrate-binding protein [Anaerolinea sp.]